MAKKSYANQKNRSESGSFFGIPHALTETRKYRSLSAKAKALILDLGSQFRGMNNGDLCATWSMMKAMGWKSSSVLYKAKTELIDAGFIMVTRQGGRHKPTLYALTWKAIDDCKGKLDIESTKAPPGNWRDDRL